ncbi:hypothetical protein DSTSK_14780 [Desulforhabdus sp. TSK]|nr:hypothetical protein DSTSK_14780 [Desulforhabdus sp. TSK]
MLLLFGVALGVNFVNKFSENGGLFRDIAFMETVAGKLILELRLTRKRDSARVTFDQFFLLCEYFLHKSSL